MPKRSNLFQDVVATIQAHVADGTVTESAMLIDRLTGRQTEVDVLIETEASGYPLTIAVEASKTKRPASVTWVETMIGKHKDLPTDKVVLVSGSGFSNNARLKAEAHGMVALSPDDLAEGDPAYKIVNQLRSIWPKVVSFTAESAKVRVKPPKRDAVWFQADPLLTLMFRDGTEIGTLFPVLGELIKAHWPTIIEQIGLRDIADDMDCWFTFGLGPPWKVGYEGKQRGVYVRYTEDSKSELQRVEAIRATGKAAVRVSEVPLSHQRLGEVMFAYGEGTIGDRPALIVATETEEGGKMTFRFRGDDGTS